jgi:hypothetical protein
MKTLSLGNLRRAARHLGQGMTEYIIIVMVMAIGSIFVYTQFGDVLRNQMAAAAKTLAGQDGSVQTAAAQGAANAASTGTSGGMGFAGGGGGYGGSGGGSSHGGDGTSGGGSSGGDGGAADGGDGLSDGDELGSPGAGGSGDLTQQNAAANVAGSDPTNADKYPAVKALIERSPTLQADINRLKAEGWRFIFRPGQSEVDDRNGNKIIYIQNNANEYGTVQRIAHEVGHVVSPLRNTWRNIEEKEAYVQRRLEDEGAAVIYNIKVRDEILQSPGGQYEDIGVNCDIPPCSTRYSSAYDKYLNGDADAARKDIALLRADELTGNNAETYKEYYTRSWNRRQQRQQSRNSGTP